MPGFPARWSNPAYWNVWGHSYCQHGFGPRSQAGRIDAFFRASIPIGYGDFTNWAVTGSRLSVEGQSQGGYARVINNILEAAPSTGPSGPPVNQGGAHLFVYGINDLGFNGDTAQYNAAYAQAMRAVISRARMSWLRPNNWAGSAGTGVFAYGAGFVNAATTGEFSTGLTLRSSTATGTTVATGSTITFTVPSDYSGETIASLWIANPGVNGGTITISGTAVSGTAYNGATFSTSNIMVSGSLNHSPVCHRIVGLPATAAGLTIIYTLTASDSNATVYFDSLWGESLTPQPVIWCNTARLLTAGYSGSYSTGIGDPDVMAFNAVQYPVIAEFQATDQMVQLADIDGAIGKDPVALIYDGLHPNEFGAAVCADAIMDALNRCNVPTSKYGITANLQSDAPRFGQDIFPHIKGQWHTTACGGPSATAVTPVITEIWAMPFLVTSGVRRVNNWSLESLAGTVAPAAWFAIYDDRAYSGYPQNKYVDTTPSTAVTLTTGTTVFNSASSGAGSIGQPLDPGLYWLVIQANTAGTGSSWRSVKGPTQYMPNLATTGGAFGAASSPVAWKLTGQTSGVVLPKTFPAGAALFDNAPMIGLKLA